MGGEGIGREKAADKAIRLSDSQGLSVIAAAKKASKTREEHGCSTLFQSREMNKGLYFDIRNE